MFCSQTKSQFLFHLHFWNWFFQSDFHWARCCKWEDLLPVVSLQLSSRFSLFVTPNTWRHQQLLHCAWQPSPAQEATSHWPRSGNNVCSWIPGKEKEGSRHWLCRESGWHACMASFHPGKQLCCCLLSCAAEVWAAFSSLCPRDILSC